nr:hypothetical protein [Tanacetum cinerariifolium]
DLEISNLKARIKFLEDKDEGGGKPSGEDAIIKGRSLETGEEACVEKSTKRGKVSTVSVPTGSSLVPTASPIFTTASVVTPYSIRKGKEKMVEADTPKKKKLQEQINVQMAREIEEHMAREDQRMDERLTMETTIETDFKREEKGKMILTEPNITRVADLSSTESDKIIEGTPIQANMDAEDTDYFDELLRLGKTYRILGFGCQKMPTWEQTLTNKTSLIFGKYLQVHSIPNDNFPLHYFNFATYKELARKVNVKSVVLTGLALWNEMATGFDMNTYTSLPQSVVIAVSSCYVSQYNGPKLGKNKKSFPISNTPGSGPAELPGKGRVLKIECEAVIYGKLPKANQNLDQLNAIFAANGLNQTEMIALSGNTFEV